MPNILDIAQSFLNVIEIWNILYGAHKNLKSLKSGVGMSNVRDTHVLIPLFSVVITRTMWDVECSRHSRVNTTVLCCRYMDTRRQLLALKRAACNEPLMWTRSESIAWGTRWMVIDHTLVRHAV
jgi:hypothetical protein